MTKKLTAIFLCLIMATACTTDQVLADLNVALQIALEIIPAVTSISSADGLALQKASAFAQGGLAVIQADYKAYEASKGASDLTKLEAALNAFKGNLDAEISAAHITNPSSVAKVTAWANLIYSVTDAILSAIPQAKASVSPKAMKLTPALPRPADLRSKWQNIKG